MYFQLSGVATSLLAMPHFCLPVSRIWRPRGSVLLPLDFLLLPIDPTVLLFLLQGQEQVQARAGAGEGAGARAKGGLAGEGIRTEAAGVRA